MDHLTNALVRFESRQSEVRRQRPRLGRDTERHERSIDIRGEFREIRRSGNAAPESTRTALVGEESHATEMQFDELRGVNRGECALDRAQLFISHVADEFERDVQIFRLHPARASGFWLEICDQFCKCTADRLRQVERNEEAHWLCPAAWVQKIAAH